MSNGRKVWRCTNPCVCRGWFELMSAWHLKVYWEKWCDSRLNDTLLPLLHYQYVAGRRNWILSVLNIKHEVLRCKEARSISTQRGIRCLYWLMITQSIIVDFLSITLMAYWTCQFAFSWVCESSRCCERPFHYEQLITSRAVNCLNGAAEFARSSFPLEKKHSNQRRDFWFWMGLRTQKADAGVGAVPAWAGDWGPGWCTSLAQKEGDVCFLDVAFKWREDYKRHISRTKPQSQGQGLSDKHICSIAHFWKQSCFPYT